MIYRATFGRAVEEVNAAIDAAQQGNFGPIAQLLVDNAGSVKGPGKGNAHHGHTGGGGGAHHGGNGGSSGGTSGGHGTSQTGGASNGKARGR